MERAGWWCASSYRHKALDAPRPAAAGFFGEINRSALWYDELMSSWRPKLIAAMLFVAVAAGCRGGAEQAMYHDVAPTPRRLVMWLQEGGLDPATAQALVEVGVDEVVQRRGVIDVAGQTPVLRLDRVAAVEGPIPVGMALEVRGARPGLDRAMADAVWRGIESQLEGAIPAELILDLPRLAQGLDRFLADLEEISGLAVTPLLSFEQLQEETGVEVARAVRTCLVPAFGTDQMDLRGIGELDPLPLDKKLAPLVGSGVRVRLGIVLRPRTEPAISGAQEDLDPLTEGMVAEVSTASTLDRTFVFKRELTWSGHSWQPGDRVAVRWMDAARLDQALREIDRMVLPEVSGWDLLPLPGDSAHLGLSRDALLRYLGGEGPAPAVEVRVERDGRSLRVTLENNGPFQTAVSSFGNWVQVSVDAGRLVAEDPGDFDHVSVGSVRGGRWQQGGVDAVDAVRFNEIYLAPGERLRSGVVRLPSSQSAAAVRWHLLLSDGSEVSGQIPQ
jgi:hypothetical protein